MPSAAAIVPVLLCLALPVYSGGGHPACLPAAEGLASSEKTTESDDRIINIVNNAQRTLTLYWLDFAGREITHGSIEPGDSRVEHSHLGHAYRLKDFEGQTFKEYVIESATSPQLVTVAHCGSVEVETLRNAFPRITHREDEFAELVPDQNAPCEPANNSSAWSCLRCLTSSQVAAREPSHFGFVEGEASAGRRVGQVLDDTYVKWIPHVPVLSDGPGFLKMNMSSKLRETLLPFYGRHEKFKQHEGLIGGKFANDANHRFDFLSLDQYLHVRHAVTTEMQAVLQWWTQQQLIHKATYGIRIYHRDAMLLNHVDRMETHLASAVLQVSQDTDDDGGWPLEVMKPDGTVCEVYLQPGEMVLYEGARLRHGRPMRFRGSRFANVFSHFAPPGWHGTETIEKNKLGKWKTDKARDGYL